MDVVELHGWRVLGLLDLVGVSKNSFQAPSSFGFFQQLWIFGFQKLCSSRESSLVFKHQEIVRKHRLQIFWVPRSWSRFFRSQVFLTGFSNPSPTPPTFSPQNQKSQQPKKDDSKAHRLLNSSVWRVGSSVRGHRKCDTTRLRSVQSPGFIVGVSEGTTCFQATQVSGSSRGIGWLGDSGVSEMCVFFFAFFLFRLG